MQLCGRLTSKPHCIPRRLFVNPYVRLSVSPWLVTQELKVVDNIDIILHVAHNFILRSYVKVINLLALKMIRHYTIAVADLVSNNHALLNT